MINQCLNASFKHFTYIIPHALLLKCLADSHRLKLHPTSPQAFLHTRRSPQSSPTCAPLMRLFSHVLCCVQHFIVHTRLKPMMPLSSTWSLWMPPHLSVRVCPHLISFARHINLATSDRSQSLGPPLHNPLPHLDYKSLQLLCQFIFTMNAQLQYLSLASVPRCSAMQQSSTDSIQMTLCCIIAPLSTIHLYQHIHSMRDLIWETPSLKFLTKSSNSIYGCSNPLWHHFPLYKSAKPMSSICIKPTSLPWAHCCGASAPNNSETRQTCKNTVANPTTLYLHVSSPSVPNQTFAQGHPLSASYTRTLQLSYRISFLDRLLEVMLLQNLQHISIVGNIMLQILAADCVADLLCRLHYRYFVEDCGCRLCYRSFAADCVVDHCCRLHYRSWLQILCCRLCCRSLL